MSSHPTDVDMGQGDVGVFVGWFADHRRVMVGFAPGQHPGEIGELRPNSVGKADDEVGVKVRLTFNKPASIDVVIDKLQKARRMLEGEDWPPEAAAPKSQRAQDLALIGGLRSARESLTPWEREFTNSLSRWLQDHDELTRRQRYTARKIHQERDDHWQEMEEVPWQI